MKLPPNKLHPNQARLLFRKLRVGLYKAAENTRDKRATWVKNDGKKDWYSTKPIQYKVPGSMWNSAHDEIKLTIQPNSSVDENEMTKDTIIFTAPAYEQVYEVSEFRAQGRSYLGHLTYEFGESGRSGKS